MSGWETALKIGWETNVLYTDRNFIFLIPVTNQQHISGLQPIWQAYLAV